MPPVHVGIIGCGTVGSGVARLLVERAEMFSRRLGVPLRLKKVAEVDAARVQALGWERDLFTSRDADVLDDPAIDIVVEVIGGVDTADRTAIIHTMVENIRQGGEGPCAYPKDLFERLPAMTKQDDPTPLLPRHWLEARRKEAADREAA